MISDSHTTSHVAFAKTPEVVKGVRIKVKGAQGSGYVFVSTDERQKPMEVFSLAKEDYQFPETADALCRLVSLCLRVGITKEKITEQLTKAGANTLGSLPSRIASALDTATGDTILECPKCSNELISQGNCETCLNCGYTACS